MRVVFPFNDDMAVDSKKLRANLIGGRQFETLVPAWVFITKSEVEQLQFLLRRVCDLSYLTEIPPRVRIDTACINNRLKVLEINSDVPAGNFFLLNSLLAYGRFEEAERFLAYLFRAFNKKIPVFLREEGPTAMASPYEFKIMREFFPEAVEALIGQDDWSVYCNDAYRIWRAVGTDYKCDLSKTPLNALNPLRSALASPKRFLADLADEPGLSILPKCYKKVVAEGEEFIVPTGWVAKGDEGLGGKQVFFAGEKVPPDVYLVQEFLELPCRQIGGKLRRYGVDLIFMGGEIFAFGRCCLMDQKLLNISAGGGIIPMEVKII